jgi:membrane-associated protease RseP (regulator of RpoE activity)
VRDEPYAPVDGDPIVWTPPPLYFAPPRRSHWKEYGRPALLFALTAGTVYVQGFFGCGWSHLESLTFVAAVLSIMLSHEMGHYVACRYYHVDATLPHFLPAPAPWVGLVGTFGAFIHIRGPMPNRRALFDIGVAGPLAGFLVTLPIVYLGLTQFHYVPVPEATEMASHGGTISLGLPPLFQLLMNVVPEPPTPDGMQGMLGPFGLAAWFGLFLTALNLMPVGQLDGGHATYALLRSKAKRISYIGSWLCVGLVYFGPSWILWAVLMRVLGRRHPHTIDDEAPVGRARVLVGLLCVAVFALSFTPSPIAGGWEMVRDLWKS